MVGKQSIQEASAVDIEDGYLQKLWELGGDELSLIDHDSLLPCSEMAGEEFILSNIDKEDQFEEVSQTFGYQNLAGEYLLVAAILKQNGIDEYHLVGATGTNYGNTQKLKVMNFKEAMATVDKEELEKAVKVEFENMVKYNVFEKVIPEDVPANTKLTDFAWAMKKKPSGKYRVRLAICGFK